MADSLRLVAATGRLEATTQDNQGKVDAWLEEMKAWRKETTACQEEKEA
jgi:hypothetical protein